MRLFAFLCFPIICQYFVTNLLRFCYQNFVGNEKSIIFALGNKILLNMARTKKEKRETSFVTIRRKERAKGRQVLYLDCYRDGKRSYEFLNLYLVPETDEAAKILNENTMTEAMAIRNQREIEIIHHGELQPKVRVKLLLSDWMEAFRKQKEKTGQSDKRALAVETVRNHLTDFRGKKTTLADVDEDFCKQFVLYLGGLTSKNSTKSHKPLTAASARCYFQIFVSALNEAVRKKLLPANPALYLNSEDKKPIKAAKSLRSYLTIDDVRKLIATDYRDEQLKRAFLFGCFTGLRISDIRNLTWADVITKNGNTYLNIVIQKTQQPFEIKLNNEALRWMPEQGKGHVFTLPTVATTVSHRLQEWAKAAGIEKNICFHMSRHTFATMALTLGADLYTVSKLLGHQNISVTQTYAEIIDEKKDKAVDLLDETFAPKPKQTKKGKGKKGTTKK